MSHHYDWYCSVGPDSGTLRADSPAHALELLGLVPATVASGATGWVEDARGLRTWIRSADDLARVISAKNAL